MVPRTAMVKSLKTQKRGRQLLINNVPDSDVLLNKERMAEREQLAQNYKLPVEANDAVSDTYVGIASKIIGEPLQILYRPAQ